MYLFLVAWRCYASLNHELFDPLDYAVKIAAAMYTYQQRILIQVHMENKYCKSWLNIQICIAD